MPSCLSESFVQEKTKYWIAPQLKRVDIYGACVSLSSCVATMEGVEATMEGVAATMEGVAATMEGVEGVKEASGLEETCLEETCLEEVCSEATCLEETCLESSQPFCTTDCELKEVRELKTTEGVLRVERRRGDVWWEEQDYELQSFHRLPEKQEAKETNLRVSFRNQTYGLLCPLYYKRRKVREAIVGMLVKNGVYVNGCEVDVVVGSHVMEEDESLQMLQVKKNDVLLVREGKSAGTFEFTLRNTKDVERFVTRASSHALDAAGRLILRVGDAKGCESYTPLSQLLDLLKGVELPWLQSLTLVYSIVGVEEDGMKCFACGSFPALLDVHVLSHGCVSEGDSVSEGVKEGVERMKEVDKVEMAKTETVESVKKEETRKEEKRTPPRELSQLQPSGDMPVTTKWQYENWTCDVTHSFFTSEKNGWKYASEEFVASAKKETLLAAEVKESRTVVFEGRRFEVPIANAEEKNKEFKKRIMKVIL